MILRKHTTRKKTTTGLKSLPCTQMNTSKRPLAEKNHSCRPLKFLKPKLDGDMTKTSGKN